MKKLAVLLLVLAFLLIGCAEQTPTPTPTEEGAGESTNTPTDTPADGEEADLPADEPADDEPADEPADEPSDDEPADEPADDEPAKSADELFWEQADGFWIDTASLQAMGGGENIFSFCSFGEGVYGGGVYPGGYDRPAKITEVTLHTETEFDLVLLYEADEEMELSEKTSTLFVRFEGEENMLLQGESNTDFHFVFGGATLEEARAVANSLPASDAE